MDLPDLSPISEKIEHTPYAHDSVGTSAVSSDEAQPAVLGFLTECVEEITGGLATSTTRNDRDEALDILGKSEGPYTVSEEDNTRVLSKIDRYLMPILFAIFFLQYMDKQTLAFASVFGLSKDTHLVRNEYSLLGSVVYMAQLLFQPLTAFLLVRLRLSFYVPFVVTCWGATLACMSAARDFKGLLIARFFLGAFEASISASFVLICQIWYRRQEQGFRIAVWSSNNGWGNVFGSLIMFGLGHIRSNALDSYQIIFMLLGIITFLVGIVCFFIFPDNPTRSSFLSDKDKFIAVERIRANQQGLETKVFKPVQVLEMILDLKSWCWAILFFLLGIPGGGITSFGPFILQGFGFDSYDVMLLNIPFGLLQVTFIYSAFWAARKFRIKAPFMLLALVPCITGASMLLAFGREKEDRPALVVAYYTLSSLNVLGTMLLNWQSTNTAGHTKKTTTTALMIMGNYVGNIVGPLLFDPSEAPYFRKGLWTMLACFCSAAVLICATSAYLFYLNKRNEHRRIAAGKKGKLVDYSMLTAHEGKLARAEENTEDSPGLSQIGRNAFEDLTDLQNNEFIYVY